MLSLYFPSDFLHVVQLPFDTQCMGKQDPPPSPNQYNCLWSMAALPDTLLTQACDTCYAEYPLHGALEPRKAVGIKIKTVFWISVTRKNYYK